MLLCLITHRLKVNLLNFVLNILIITLNWIIFTCKRYFGAQLGLIQSKLKINQKAHDQLEELIEHSDKFMNYGG